ncbi:hypothetical protein [Spirosoma arcticum]
MTDNDNQEGRRQEQQDLEQQQQDLFGELSREQREAEQALRQDDEEESAGANAPDTNE